MLFDTGWAGTFPMLCRALGENKLKLQDIDYLLISHFHPDHMGIAQDIADSGVKIAAADVQRDYIHSSDGIFAREKNTAFIPIKDDAVRIVSISESRAFPIAILRDAHTTIGRFTGHCHEVKALLHAFERFVTEHALNGYFRILIELLTLSVRSDDDRVTGAGFIKGVDYPASSLNYVICHRSVVDKGAADKDFTLLIKNSFCLVYGTFHTEAETCVFCDHYVFHAHDYIP